MLEKMIVNDKLITMDVLEFLFIQIGEYLNDQLKKYPTWNIGLYSDTQWFLCSCSTGDDAIITVAYNRTDIDSSRYRAERMFIALWEQEFPLHTIVKALQEQATMCAAFLRTFLMERQLSIIEPPNKCYGCHAMNDIPGYCDYCRGLLYGSNQNIQNLLYDFFEIDKAALEIERAKILEGLKK